MSLNTLYIAANCLALGGWIVLFVSVFKPGKVPFISARAIPVVLALVYSVLMLGLLPLEGGGFGSLEALSKLFAQPEIALVGWIHYLAFDLFIGGWQVQTAKRQQLPNGIVLPSMLLTLLLGPLGLLFFLVARYIVFSRSAQSPQPSLDASNG